MYSGWLTYSHIAPLKKLLNLFLSIDILKESQYTLVKVFWICDCICPGEYRWGTEGRLCLKKWLYMWQASGEDYTWVAMYTMDGEVTWVIPWILALPDLVAFITLSTELGDVNAYRSENSQEQWHQPWINVIPHCTDHYKNRALKETLPWLFRIKFIIDI